MAALVLELYFRFFHFENIRCQFCIELYCTVQGFAKHLTVIFCHKSIYDQIIQLRNVHVANNRDILSENHAILQRSNNNLLLLVKFFFALCIGAVGSFIIYPLPVYLITGKRLLMFPLYMPFLDEDTLVGYCGLSFLHSLWLVQSGVGLAAGDLLFALNILYVLPMVQLFRKRFEELNFFLEMGKSAQNSELVYKCLRNLVKMHQEICRLVENTQQLNLLSS